MTIQWSEAEYRDYQAQLRRMRGESDDVDDTEDCSVSGTGGRSRRGRGAGISRARRGDDPAARDRGSRDVLAQAPIRHEHVHHTTTVDPRTPVRVGRWLRLALTAASLSVWGVQIGQWADVSGPVLLATLCWLLVAFLTRRSSRRSGGGLLWGVLFGVGVEATLRNGREWRGMSGGL